uniref:Uncharacterized protein n=1 Tax=Meloidogyne enterolobii TaxID=390850 RepID=A0A6V7TYL5_MELEN|nr:unnamed protein product [Meloidogyne enterolobii]
MSDKNSSTFRASIPSLFESTIFDQSQSVVDAHNQLLTPTTAGDHKLKQEGGISKKYQKSPFELVNNNDVGDKTLTMSEAKTDDYSERPLSLTKKSSKQIIPEEIGNEEITENEGNLNRILNIRSIRDSMPNRTDCPTFRANVPSLLFESTIHDQTLNEEDEQDYASEAVSTPTTIPNKCPTFRANISSLFESTINTCTDTSTPFQKNCPTFRANIPSLLFESTILDQSLNEEANKTPTPPNKCPTFRASIPSFFESTICQDSVVDDRAQSHDFETAGPSTSTNFPKPCSSLNKNQFVLIKGTPCKVRELIRPSAQQSFETENIENNPSPNSSYNFDDRRSINMPSILSNSEQTFFEKSPTPSQAKISLFQADQTLDIYDDETDGGKVEEAEEKDLSQSSNFYASPPKHFLHTVCINKPPRLTYQPKIIRPDPESPSVVQLGLRRSKRNRLPPLQHHLGQKAIYEIDMDGNRVLVGATEVEPKDNLCKKYGVLNIVKAAEKEDEAKKFKRRTQSIMKRRRQERFKHELSKVKEEDE